MNIRKLKDHYNYTKASLQYDTMRFLSMSIIYPLMKTSEVTLRIYQDLLGLILYVTIQVSSSDEQEYGLPGGLTSRILITLGLFS